MSLFQRIRTPFSERVQDDLVQPGASSHAVGALLRERREELGLDLNAIGEALRIKPVYLAALEQGRGRDLPGPTYAIGFVRAYAQHLGLDGERILDRLKAESAEIHARPDLTLPVPLGERSLPGGSILLVGLILALCGYGSWYYLSTGERTRPERVAAVPMELQQAVQATRTSPLAGVPPLLAKPAGPGDAAAATRLGTGLSPPQDASPPPGVAASAPNPGLAASPPSAAPAAGAPSGDTAVKPSAGIDIRAVADCWIQVRAGDSQSIVFSRVLKAGETYHVPRPGLLLRTGNAGALAIMVDGKPAPSIGAIGALRRSVALDPSALLAGTAVRG